MQPAGPCRSTTSWVGSKSLSWPRLSLAEDTRPPFPSPVSPGFPTSSSGRKPRTFSRAHPRRRRRRSDLGRPGYRRLDVLLNGGGRLLGCTSGGPLSGCEKMRVAQEVVVVQEGVLRAVIAA